MITMQIVLAIYLSALFYLYIFFLYYGGFYW